MADLRMVYLSGEPGVGKSTLMQEITRGWQRLHLPREPSRAPARDVLADNRPPGRIVAVEIGRQRGAFSGTDALPSDCINDACTYLISGQAAREAPLLLAEGARLANLRYLCAAVDAGYRVQLLHMHGEELAARRRSYRARDLAKPEQNAAWVKGRRTASARLAEAAVAIGADVLLVDASKLEDDLDYHDAVINTVRGSHANLTPR
jgi:hypothetical protein